MGTTRTEELLKFCQTPRSFSELEAAGYNTMRGVIYRLETSGHLARKGVQGAHEHDGHASMAGHR